MHSKTTRNPGHNTLGDAFLFDTPEWATRTAFEVLSMALIAVVVVVLLPREARQQRGLTAM